MKHILIPTDFSNNSWNALEYAACFFEKKQCIFYVLHVNNLSNSDITGNSFMTLNAQKKYSTRDKLNETIDRIGTCNPNPKHKFISLEEYGNFIDITKKTIEEKKIDLIVMGTKGISGLKASIMGSNTGNVITKIACNVLVIPDAIIAKKPSKIAFPTDFNLFYTYPILNSITEILEISNAKLEVIHMSQSRPNFSNTQVINKAYLHDYLKEICSETHSFEHILGKNTREVIVTYITENKIEMLTMVAKNLNLFQQLFFNNSLEHLSYHSTVPLLVMHE
ncbi:universal stress protein [Maribacter ulvicola]|uniref:Nucleotide-binding universal stress protein, UspA family n=1 Tax=Maribacter ulvicola TaxID=228959 RepID=A0A1N6ZRC3_9FLAO|nr:universal stress protein [Maribacter ulvicola]SIR29337.1 Nucleotide-binding universal stress protein, UspA family [Maribacter ulvicola]